MATGQMVAVRRACRARQIVGSGLEGAGLPARLVGGGHLGGAGPSDRESTANSDRSLLRERLDLCDAVARVAAQGEAAAGHDGDQPATSD
jgi:hypothetical protein